MPKAKPLMTPEQQKSFKAAVAAKAIEALPYGDYCKITPEEADKLLKEAEQKMKVMDKPSQAPTQSMEKENAGKERPAPTIKDPDAPATVSQKRAISEAVKAGDMESIPKEQWETLTKGEASKILGELYARKPPAPATESQMREINKLVKEGRIFPMKTETYNSLSKDKASTLIGIGRMNEENNRTVEGYDPDYVSRQDQPMTADQSLELKRLVAEKRLNPVPREEWRNLTQGAAGKLIYIGHERENAGELAPERPRERERSADEQSPEKPERPAPSRADDMPM